MILFLTILFIVLILIPFIPVIIEIINPKGLKQQFIDMDYIKDINYFEKSFSNNLLNNLGKDPKNGMVEIVLSKKELVEITDSKVIPPDKTISHIIYVKGDLETGPNIKFEKEIFVSGNVIFGENNIIRAVVSKNEITFLKKTRLVRWAGSEKNIIVHENCNLGIKTSCEGKMEIGSGCKFRYIYGKPIVTRESSIHTEVSDLSKENNQFTNKNEEIKNSTWFIDNKQLSIPPYTIIEKNLVLTGGLYISQGCFVTGSVKTHGKIFLEDNVTMQGDIFSDSDIIIGKNCVINGNIFTQKTVIIHEGTQVSKNYEIKTILGKKKVELSNNVTIYGSVLTEGIGKVL